MREEEKKQSSQKAGFKRFFKKRWVFPAVYIASAAIILTAVLWYQNISKDQNTDKYKYEATKDAGKNKKEPAVEVNRSMENFVMPVTNPDTVEIDKQFYDMNGSEKEQEDALVVYNNTYYPSTGIDIKSKDGKTFNVVAALSGTVTSVKEDSLLGNVIEIEHDEGIITQYQSIADISVKEGDQIEQGQTLAKAGKSQFDEKAGIHVHFEIRKDNVPVNPLDYFNRPFSALQEADVTGTTKPVDNSGATDNSTEGADKATDPESKDSTSDKKVDSDQSNQTDEDEVKTNNSDVDTNSPSDEESLNNDSVGA
ncbi:peptidoglycan DD-metalloendopeptidase family protein [Cytobacillus sp. Hz8]|uniref:peptidoglycan DD-metalloendopeptidase family protein n=1 Tax=Cytobacillus sp. Hz8 TaxID=3347168 RepID=UPI0035DFBD19